jgi:hypothetical protein
VTEPARQRDRPPISTGEPGPATGAPRRRRPIAFGLHQFLECLVAVALVLLSVHIGRSRLLLAAGVVFGLLALTARGPLGLLRVCGRRLHAVLDVGVGLLLAASPLVPALRPGVAGIVAVELAAVALLRVSMLTRYSARLDPTPLAAKSGVVRSDASPASAIDTGPVTTDEPPGPALAAFHGLGRMVAGAQARLPDAQTALEAGARHAGGQAGRLQRAWRRAGR